LKENSLAGGGADKMTLQQIDAALALNLRFDAKCAHLNPAMQTLLRQRRMELERRRRELYLEITQQILDYMRQERQ